MDGDQIHVVTAHDVLGALPRAATALLRDVDELAARLTLHYGTGGRAYHTLAHLRTMALEWTTLWNDADAATCRAVRATPREWVAALLWHDAVYVPGRTDNEAKSAVLARQEAPRFVPGVDLTVVDALIAFTASHGHVSPSEVSPGAALFLDLDMAILAAAPAVYDRYAAGVAEEYLPVVGADAYRTGRAAFLRDLLNAPRRFLSPAFHASRDATARANLARELAALEAGAT